MAPCLTALIECSLPLRGGPPHVVDDVGRFPVDVALLSLQVFGPQAQAGRPDHLLVVGHDVDLGVVEERVFVEVGRPDGHPFVVDDPDFGVDVDRGELILVVGAR